MQNLKLKLKLLAFSQELLYNNLPRKGEEECQFQKIQTHIEISDK